MQIKRYRGTDMQDALQKVKEDLGQNAVILSTRQVRSGTGTFGLFGKPMLEVTAARDTDVESMSPGLVSGGPATDAAQGARVRLPGFGKTRPPEGSEDMLRQILAKTRVETQQLLTPLQDDLHELKEILSNVGDAQRSLLRDERGIAQIRGELGELRQQLLLLTQQNSGLRDSDLGENLLVLYQQLCFNGLEEKFSRRMVEEAQKNIPARELEDFNYVKIFLARMLMKILKVTGGVQPPQGRQKIVALIGPTGVGKTTTLAKLAGEQSLKHGRKVALITVDTFRIAAVEQLKTYARIMGLPITVVNSRAELRQAIESHSAHDCLFIDTAGRSQRDDLQMNDLREMFGDSERTELMLCLSATTKDADLTDVTRRFSDLPLSSITFTKLDESNTYGSLFNHAIRFKLPIGYLTTGQKVPEDIEIATKERLVDLMLNLSGN
ncbi:MAG: flagellar biosynthesis protein FlhF [Deltaproteobacteria bacterium]|nr:flagellar biosynthesis protein FlhF [Deltaproteobacteria bacterium]